MEPYYSDALTTIYHGECLAVMAELAPASFDAIICDPPYGTTACAWDSVIPFEPMWAQLKRLIKPRGAIVLFGSQPFTSALIMSNPKQYRYSWIWNKGQSGNIGLAKYQPLKITEDIAVFSRYPHLYQPIMRQGLGRMKGGTKKPNQIATGIKQSIAHWSDQYYPTNILNFPNSGNKGATVHPTQKPLDLMEYLIKTYTNEGERVLDFTFGSGTTLRAAKNLKRHSVGIELLEQYCNAAVRRLAPTFEEPIRDATPVAALGPLFDL